MVQNAENMYARERELITQIRLLKRDLAAAQKNMGKRASQQIHDLRNKVAKLEKENGELADEAKNLRGKNMRLNQQLSAARYRLEERKVEVQESRSRVAQYVTREERQQIDEIAARARKRMEDAKGNRRV